MENAMFLVGACAPVAHSRHPASLKPRQKGLAQTSPCTHNNRQWLALRDPSYLRCFCKGQMSRFHPNFGALGSRGQG